MSALTVQEMDECLKGLVNWQRFAIHLPEIEPEDISIIVNNKRDDICDQRLALYEKWLHAYPDASWDDVIQALEIVKEDTIASKLKVKFPKTQQSTTVVSSKQQSEVHKQVVSETAHVKVSEDIVDELESLHSDFVLLVTEVKSKVKRDFEKDEKSLDNFVEYVEEQKAFNVELQSVQTTDQFFQAIKPHYNFLDCYLIISLAILLSGNVAHKANQYKDRSKQFMRKTSVKDLQNKLQQYFVIPQSNDRIKVSIALENAWGTQNVWLVKQLIKQFFSLQHPDQCQWFQVISGSVIVVLLAPKYLTRSLTENSKKRLQLMRLLGIFRLQIGDALVLSEKENEMFSFDNSLIQATVESNVEVVQFLLQSMEVDVNTQRGQKIYKVSVDAQPIDLEKFVTVKLKEFHASFISLIKDVEFELQSAIQNGEIIIEDLPKHAGFPKDIRCEEIILHIKANSSLLNCHLLIGLGHILSDSLAQKINYYSNKIEWFKTVTQYESLWLSNFEQFSQIELSETVKISIVLGNEWVDCSIWCIEQLLQSIFSVLPSVFHWFKINLTLFDLPKDMFRVVFLAPEQLSTIFIENSKQKLQFVKLTGVIRIDIGGMEVFKNKIKSKYSFKERIVQAKSIGNLEAYNFLLQINEASLYMFSKETWKKDNNNNNHFVLEPDSTPLMVACSNNDSQMVKFLLASHANPNIHTGRKFTALMYASGSIKIFKMLLDHNADTNVINLKNQNVMHWASFANNSQVVDILLKKKCDFVNMKDGEGQTPLHIAIRYGQLRIVKQLLQANTHHDLQDINGDTPLNIACKHGHLEIVKQLLQAQADPNISNTDGKTPLYVASSGGHLQIVEQLIQAQVNPNIPNVNGETPLYTACEYGELEVVQQLIQAEADPNISNNDGITPLYIASSDGHLEIVETLLQAQADPNIPNIDGETPLYTASKYGELEVVQRLIQAQADPNVSNNDEKTPLYIASCKGLLEIVKTLLQAQADPNIPSNNEETPLYTACEYSKLEVVQQLVKAQADPNIPNRYRITPLYVASSHGYLQIVEQLLQAQVNPNIPNIDGETPLYTACKYSKLEVVQRLIHSQADPNISNNDEETPLYIASCGGHSQIVETLLQAQVNPNIPNIDGETPLYTACKYSKLEVVQQLIHSPADPNIPNNDEETPLYIASHGGHSQIVETLLQAQVNPNIPNVDGETPLYTACKYGKLEVVQRLIQSQADPNISNNDEETPLYIASRGGHSQIVETLLQAQVNPNIPNIDGETPLYTASKYGKLEVVQRLIQSQADLNVSNNDRKTPLYVASCEGHLEIVKTLLQAQADPNIPSNYGETPLYTACKYGQLEIIKQLLWSQADYNISDNEGRTPLYIACWQGKLEVVKQLLYAKADPNLCTSGKTSLHTASFNDQLGVLKLLLEAQGDPNIRDEYGRTPLYTGNRKVVEHLLLTKADPNVRDHDGRTPLHAAILYGIQEIIEPLLQANADPNIPDCNGETPLYMASYRGELKLVKRLLKAHPDPTICANNGRTPVDVAFNNGYSLVAEEILKKMTESQ